MDEIERIPADASDEAMGAAENAASAIEPETSEAIKLICPVCHTSRFELIRIRPGRYQLFWKKPGRTADAEAKMQRLIGRRRVEAYRCRHCDYVMSFAR